MTNLNGHPTFHFSTAHKAKTPSHHNNSSTGSTRLVPSPTGDEPQATKNILYNFFLSV